MKHFIFIFISLKSIVGCSQSASEIFSSKLLSLVNEKRSTGCKCGTKYYQAIIPLKWNILLTKAASLHANDMYKNNFFDHTNPNGITLKDRIYKTGYKWSNIGENIAMGKFTINEVIAAWLLSPSHCKQIMNPKVKEMGVANIGEYWVMDFGSN